MPGSRIMSERRILSLWLPDWPIDRLRRATDAPAGVLVLATGGVAGRRLTAVSPEAAAEGLAPGMTLTDARALVPGLRARDADPRADAAALRGLADWALRYSPWVALDGVDGLILDITGVAHLFGSGPPDPRRRAADEAALMTDLVARLALRGITARVAVAPTAAAAAALARFGPRRPEARIGAILEPGELAAIRALDDLPVAALRLDPALAETWRRLGLATIGDLARLPRPGLARRFGAAVLDRLDEALGRVDTPIAPLRPMPAYHVRRAFPEPVTGVPVLVAALRDLAEALSRVLASDGRGARRLEAWLFQADGGAVAVPIATARPTRDPAHLARLFEDKLTHDGGDRDGGFGFDALVLAVTEAEVAAPVQPDLAPPRPARGGVSTVHGVDDLGALVDRLGNRLGLERVGRLSPRASHVPEGAVMFESLAQAGLPETPVQHDWRADERARLPRPLRLLGAPEPVEVVAEVPDGPPARFRWRRVDYRVAVAEGPERLAPEWWRRPPGAPPAPTRDYFRVEDTDGRRFWLYRDGLFGEVAAPRWYLHGVFA